MGYEYHIVRSEHKNTSVAINQGLSYVTGEYLIWPDSEYYDGDLYIFSIIALTSLLVVTVSI